MRAAAATAAGIAGTAGAGIITAAGTEGGDVGGIAAGQPQPDQDEDNDPPPVIETAAAATAVVASTGIAAHSRYLQEVLFIE